MSTSLLKNLTMAFSLGVIGIVFCFAMTIYAGFKERETRQIESAPVAVPATSQ